MFELLKKDARPEQGTYWVEFNVSGDVIDYQHWAEDSLYADPDEFVKYHAVWSETLDDFNGYGPNLVGRSDLETLIAAFEIILSRDNSDVNSHIAEFIAFLENCKKTKVALWILGV